MLETSFKVGLQPEGGNYRHLETKELNSSIVLKKKRQQRFGNNTTCSSKFATQCLLVFHFFEILLVTLN